MADSATANDATTITTDPADGDMTAVASVSDSYIGVYTFDNLHIRGAARVKTEDNIIVTGTLEVSDDSELHYCDPPVISEDPPVLAPARQISKLQFNLLNNFPNPFNPETWIPYELADDADVMIEIYNVNGQLVRRLNIGHQTRGRYTSREKAAYWDGSNEWGEKSASGVYFCSFSAGDYVAARKMVILQ